MTDDPEALRGPLIVRCQGIIDALGAGADLQDCLDAIETLSEGLGEEISDPDEVEDP